MIPSPLSEIEFLGGTADVSRLLPLAFLSPDIIESILAGRQPVGLTAQKLKRLPRLAIGWSDQSEQLGFAR